MTFEVDGAEVREVIKVSPTDLADEVRQLRRAAAQYAAFPQVLGVNGDHACPRTAELSGVSAAHPHSLAEPNGAVQAIDAGQHARDDPLPAP
ncbi:MAG: hypothetical protein ACREOE_08650 [Gemmatimonadales bacterium]